MGQKQPRSFEIWSVLGNVLKFRPPATRLISVTWCYCPAARLRLFVYWAVYCPNTTAMTSDKLTCLFPFRSEKAGEIATIPLTKVRPRPPFSVRTGELSEGSCSFWSPQNTKQLWGLFSGEYIKLHSQPLSFTPGPYMNISAARGANKALWVLLKMKQRIIFITDVQKSCLNLEIFAQKEERCSAPPAWCVCLKVKVAQTYSGVMFECLIFRRLDVLSAAENSLNTRRVKLGPISRLWRLWYIYGSAALKNPVGC